MGLIYWVIDNEAELNHPNKMVRRAARARMTSSGAQKVRTRPRKAPPEALVLRSHTDSRGEPVAGTSKPSASSGATK